MDIDAVLIDSQIKTTIGKCKKTSKRRANETITKCSALKIITVDEKKRLVVVATTQELLFIIYCILFSKKEYSRVVRENRTTVLKKDHYK